MAVDILLKIDGIKGESHIDGHKDQIDVLAWSWGMSNHGTHHTGGGGGAGKVNVQDLSFTHYIDTASPKLMLSCADGSHIKEATLTVRKAGGKALDYLKIKMSDILITSVSTGGSGGEDRLTENVSMNFAKIELSYKSQTEKGAGGGDAPFGWDIKANKKI